MKLKSFGCSLIFGTDLHDDGKYGHRAIPSRFSWPALVAKSLGYDYECYARPGSGNLQIWEKLINALSDPDPSLYVIGWTWIDRFDYIRADSPPWPGGGASWSTIMPIDTDDLAKTYFRNLHSERRDKLVSLQCISSAINLLKSRQHQFIMMYLDDLIFNQNWNNSPGMSLIQENIKPYLSSFDGKNFIDYSRDRGHEISATMHPLESAHEDAARLVLDNLDDYIKS